MINGIVLGDSVSATIVIPKLVCYDVFIKLSEKLSMRFLRKLIRFFKIQSKIGKSGFTVKGFWGEKKHYNKDGVQIGYTIKGFWGERKRYDMNGNLLSYSIKSFWGGYDTYDANGNLIRRSRKNFWGGYNTYDKNGKKTHESYRNFWEGMNHYEVEEPVKYVEASIRGFHLKKKSVHIRTLFRLV